VIARELESQLLSLPERERAGLASMLLSSLPPVQDGEDGLKEALRREAELEADPYQAMTLDEFERQFSTYRTV
jgi:hypothetical protein